MFLWQPYNPRIFSVHNFAEVKFCLHKSGLKYMAEKKPGGKTDFGKKAWSKKSLMERVPGVF